MYFFLSAFVIQLKPLPHHPYYCQFVHSKHLGHMYMFSSKVDGTLCVASRRSVYVLFMELSKYATPFAV